MPSEIDIETLTRPGGIVPVDVETTAALVRRVLELVEALKFYANPKDYTDTIPDFYSELDFAAVAQAALAKIA